MHGFGGVRCSRYDQDDSGLRGWGCAESPSRTIALDLLECHRAYRFPPHTTSLDRNLIAKRAVRERRRYCGRHVSPYGGGMLGRVRQRTDDADQSCWGRRILRACPAVAPITYTMQRCDARGSLVELSWD